MQSVPIVTNVLSSNPAHGKVYSIQHYVIKFVSDLRQVVGFLHKESWPPQYSWNIVESDVKHHKFFITLTHNFVKFPSDKKSTYEKDKDNEEDVSDEEQTPTNTGDEDKEAEDVHNTVTKSQDIIGISKTHGISHLSQAASIVIGGNGTGSLTKLDSDSVGTTPSFKTRKR